MYNPTNQYSYTSPKGTGTSHGNGCIDQQFTSKSNLTWRVLSVDKTTKEVILISDENIGNISFYGPVGYLYAEQELNEICKIYGYGKGANTSKSFVHYIGDESEGLTTRTVTGSGARNLNIEDINKLTGYIPNVDSTLYTNSRIYPSKKTDKGYTNDSETRKVRSINNYRYERDDYSKSLSSEGSMALGWYFPYNKYWLASRGVDYASGYISYSVLTCTEYGSVGMKETLVYSDGTRSIHPRKESPTSINGGSTDLNTAHTSGVRAIVYLKPTVRTYTTFNDDKHEMEFNIVDE